ncbi:MAG: nucleotide exchange factor GrpE [Candidatus Gracilibacteria bacterium]|nr:nucleotide exchange factor GrpE [Candidatus Gracilibacteria bacterium]
MTSEEKNKVHEQDIIDEMQEELEEIETSEGDIIEEKVEEALNPETQEELSTEEEGYKDKLLRTMADYENFKKRVERDKQDMIFFLKSDIFKKILPRLDDLERIIKNTPLEMQNGVLFEGILSLETKFKKDIDSMGVKSFESKGSQVDPDKHDVMTTVPGQKEGIVFDEFEKGYMLGDRVLRHAKVVVGAGE